MMIPKPIQESIVDQLSLAITNFSFSSGGCINNGGRLSTSSGDFFLKWNSSDRYPAMFNLERKGLDLLRETNTIYLPKVVCTIEINSWQYILLEYIESGTPSATYWQNLGEHLAALHKYSNESFGLDHDNYIGSLSQKNTNTKKWIDFFIQHRLDPQLQRLVDNNSVDNTFVKALEALYRKLSEIMPTEPSSLLHGDLWIGNVLTNTKGDPYVIDPAVYYGHREAEIAFTKLFGGFEPSFYKAYDNYFPLQPGFELRYEVYNLYPLLVHANLFGDSYLHQAKRIIKSFT